MKELLSHASRRPRQLLKMMELPFERIGVDCEHCSFTSTILFNYVHALLMNIFSAPIHQSLFLINCWGHNVMEFPTTEA
jgi:hypothetical protein